MPSFPLRTRTVHACRGAGARADAWQVLRLLAAERLSCLRAEHSGWSMAQAVAHLAVRRTPFLLQLLGEAGFATGTTAADAAAVVQADACQRQVAGTADWPAIVVTTGVPLAEVEAILATHGGYGVAAYGRSPYGGNRQRSQGGAPVSRQVSANGQFSYGGRTYGLGRHHQGRTILVREHAHHLDIESADGRRLRVDR
jgi:hypothetical protein